MKSAITTCTQLKNKHLTKHMQLYKFHRRFRAIPLKNNEQQCYIQYIKYRTICKSGVTCLRINCCFSELPLKILIFGLVQNVHVEKELVLTGSCNDIAEKLLAWH
jgi:hypothetical protein